MCAILTVCGCIVLGRKYLPRRAFKIVLFPTFVSPMTPLRTLPVRKLVVTSFRWAVMSLAPISGELAILLMVSITAATSSISSNVCAI